MEYGKTKNTFRADCFCANISFLVFYIINARFQYNVYDVQIEGSIDQIFYFDPSSNLIKCRKR